MSDAEKMDKMRLDKWLWAARFYKTRALAKAAIVGGKVHINGNRGKPSQSVRVGETLELTLNLEVRELTVVGLNNYRRQAAEAQGLYQESQESITVRTEAASLRKLQAASKEKSRRPTKKERRDILRLKRVSNSTLSK